MVPSFEGQLVPLAQHIVQLRRKPEFTAINQIADHLLQPAWSNKRKRCADLQEEQVDCYKYICCFSTFYQVVKDLQEAEARIGRLSPAQRNFIALQSQKNALVEIGRKRKRSNEEEAMLRRIQNKLKHSKRDMSDYDERLLIKQKPKSDAQRKAKMRESQGKRRDPSGAQREARRKEGRTPEKVRKERTDQRVSKVAQRAGGLSQARKEDVRAGRMKNKDTEVFSGDALKTKKITEGIFIVEPLTGGLDGLGNLGDIVCSYCGALK